MLESDTRTVLLVEDNIDDERLMLRALSMNGNRTHLIVCRSGEEALNLLLPQGEADQTTIRPALILLDLKLPRMNGAEVVRELRRHVATRFIPVVALTVSDERSDIAAAMEAGCNSYVRKSMNYEEFIDNVRQLEQYWLHTNVPYSTVAAAAAT